MIEARELTKRYGDTTAVHSLSFTIAPGTVTGLLGPNGAGKSTTMRKSWDWTGRRRAPSPSTASPTGSTVPRYARSAPCWRQAPCTPAAAIPITAPGCSTYSWRYLSYADASCRERRRVKGSKRSWLRSRTSGGLPWHWQDRLARRSGDHG